MSANLQTEMDSTSGDLFDVRTARLWAGFFIASVRRHWRRAAVGFVAVLTATMFFVMSSEKAFAADTLIVTRPNLVAPSIVNPSRTVPQEADDPTRNAEEIVLRDENLLKIVEQAKLVDLWNRNEPKLAKMKRKFFEAIFGANPDPAVKRDQLRNLLRASISVETSEKESVRISVSWNDPDQAAAIADAAMKNFLEDRERIDVGPLEEALSTAQAYADEANRNVEALRGRLGIAESSTDPLPESSPMRPALATQNTALQRLDSARVELDVAKKAFGYKYQVITRPKRPDAPVSGSSKLLMLGLIAAMMTGVLAAALSDLLRGRIVEPWQLTRRLGLPILAQIPAANARPGVPLSELT